MMNESAAEFIIKKKKILAACFFFLVREVVVTAHGLMTNSFGIHCSNGYMEAM